MVICDQWSVLFLWLSEGSDGYNFLAKKYFLIKTFLKDAILLLTY